MLLTNDSLHFKDTHRQKLKRQKSYLMSMETRKNWGNNTYKRQNKF